MKKIGLSLYYSTLFIICQCLAAFVGAAGANAAGVNDFYFDDFTGDYYLTKDAEGVSHLKVKESVTAVFPEYKQNKGICRQIPFTNQGGENITLPSLTRANLTVTRNGAAEPIYSIEKSGNFYNVCTGTEEYVLGRQTYTFEYEFEKVVTQFDGYQELYWDTNGNGATQKFNSVTARVHFAKDVAAAYSGKTWCYVGAYGESGQDRCEISKLDDGVQYTAENLKAYENLTFDVELKDGSFVVPAPAKDYTLVWIMVGAGILLVALIVAFPLRSYLKTKEKREYYKRYFVKPEYQPAREYTVAEMAEVYLGKKKEPKVAVMLDMIVKKQLEIIKTGDSKRNGWKVKVLSLADMSDEGLTLLTILNNGVTPELNEEIEIKTRTATSRLVNLAAQYDKDLNAALVKDGLFESGKKGLSSSGSATIVAIMIAVVFMIVVIPNVLSEASNIVSDVVSQNHMVGNRVFVPVMMGMVVVAMIVWSVLSRQSKRYAVRTMKGLEMSRYMDGLELYIRMAEADRLKFMQSVNGADTSPTGIVHLYEKLLPYAALLGLEESWMKELEKYYKLDERLEPDWYHRGIRMHDMYYMSTLASNTVRTSTTMASSGGSSSSSFSGGGGGGFSGGGGGGGGFSGR
ncbi:DUF2207 domain-containing protein [Candidatus Saccharibacteria bacterium]|nr:DUF2207 domain-containing protein [Candidatus Saccharibacteria bacterium]